MKAWEVMAWAWSVVLHHASDRLVLLAYADRAGEKLVAWPGLDELRERTLLSRETITSARGRLIDYGYLADTGTRRGHFGRVAVYQLQIKRKTPLIDLANKAENSAHCARGERGKFVRSSENPASIQAGNPAQNLSMNNPLNSSGAQAREQSQVAQAPDPERPQEQIARVEGFASPIDRLKGEFPHLFKEPQQ